MLTNHECSLERRQFLASQVMCLGSVALTWLLKQDRVLGETKRPELAPPAYTLAAKQPHYPARANAMISLWMQGGPSHHDLFDPNAPDTYFDPVLKA